MGLHKGYLGRTTLIVMMIMIVTITMIVTRVVVIIPT